MRKVPSQRPEAMAVSRSPNRTANIDRSKSGRKTVKNIKKIADACDLLDKKKVTGERAYQDQRDNEVYWQVLQERMSRKDAKFEKPSKKMIEAQKAEVALAKEQLAALMKDLEHRKETLESLKAYLLHLVREFRKYIKGYADKDEKETSELSVKGLSSAVKVKAGLRKSKSQNLFPKPVKEVQQKTVHFGQMTKDIDKLLKPADAVREWGIKRRSTISVPKQVNGETVQLATKFEGTVTEDTETGRGRTNTTRFQLTHNRQMAPSGGVLNKSNIRQSIFGATDQILPLKDFAKLQKVHNKKSHAEIADLLQDRPGLPDLREEDPQSDANSNLSDSIVEEVKEEMKMKLMKQSQAGWSEGQAFDYKVVLPNFQPLKVSFKVGVPEQKGLPHGIHILQKDRVFKGFQIYEMEWHFKNKALCGVRMILRNWDSGFMLGGNFHGKIGDFVDVCRFNRDERMAKIEFAHDSSAVRFLEVITTEGRRFVVGIDRKEATTLGLSFVNRYYPQEIMLCKFFCQFNKMTQAIDFVRFLFVRIVLY